MLRCVLKGGCGVAVAGEERRLGMTWGDSSGKDWRLMMMMLRD